MDQKSIKRAVLLAAVPTLGLVAGCQQSEETATDNVATEETTTEEASTVEVGIQVTDSADRDVTIEGPVETIVVEQPSQAEIINELGEVDKIVGRGSYVNYPSIITEVTDVGSGPELNFEQIINLDPDIVFIGFSGDMETQIQTIEEAGIPVVVVHADTLDQVYETTELIGTILGSEDAAESAIKDMQDTFKEFETLADEQDVNEEELTSYYEISQLEFGLWAAGSNTFMDELGEMLNLTNAFEDVEGFGEISEEQVLKRDPNYIITTSTAYEGFEPVDEILNRSGWETVSAVENEQVFMADADEFTRPGPRLKDAIESLYNFVYGE